MPQEYNSLLLVQFLKPLAAQREVVIFDNIGAGRTNVAGGVNKTRLTITRMADSTLGLTKALGLSKPNVLG